VTTGSAGGPPQAGRLTFSDITISKQLDGTTASIAKAMQRGPIDTVEVVELMDNANIAGLYPALSLKVFNVFIDGYSVSSGGDRPSESVSLNFTRIVGTTLTPDLKGGNLIKDSWTYDALKG
jgi:type VI secretion system secreted protein Hcp